MSPFTPVDFIAPMVDIFIVYDKDSSEEIEAKWEACTIQKVHKRGLTEDGDKFVVCDVAFVDEPTNHVRETLYDSDFETISNFAWVFSPNFTPLIHQLMTVHKNDADDTESNSDIEESEEITCNPPVSLLNRTLVTLWMLGPWFATLAVVYNAREDIIKYLHNKYMS